MNQWLGVTRYCTNLQHYKDNQDVNQQSSLSSDSDSNLATSQLPAQVRQRRLSLPNKPVVPSEAKPKPWVTNHFLRAETNRQSYPRRSSLISPLCQVDEHARDPSFQGSTSKGGGQDLDAKVDTGATALPPPPPPQRLRIVRLVYPTSLAVSYEFHSLNWLITFLTSYLKSSTYSYVYLLKVKDYGWGSGVAQKTRLEKKTREHII